MFARIAQLVEHLTLNQGVQGSSPCAGRCFFKNSMIIYAIHAAVAKLADAQDLGSCGATRGSSSLSRRILVAA